MEKQESAQATVTAQDLKNSAKKHINVKNVEQHIITKTIRTKAQRLYLNQKYLHFFLQKLILRQTSHFDSYTVAPHQI